MPEVIFVFVEFYDVKKKNLELYYNRNISVSVFYKCKLTPQRKILLAPLNPYDRCLSQPCE